MTERALTDILKSVVKAAVEEIHTLLTVSDIGAWYLLDTWHTKSTTSDCTVCRLFQDAAGSLLSAPSLAPADVCYSGTSACVCVVRGCNLVVANVGCCRAVVGRVTKDVHLADGCVMHHRGRDVVCLVTGHEQFSRPRVAGGGSAGRSSVCPIFPLCRR